MLFTCCTHGSCSTLSFDCPARHILAFTPVLLLLLLLLLLLRSSRGAAEGAGSSSDLHNKPVGCKNKCG